MQGNNRWNIGYDIIKSVLYKTHLHMLCAILVWRMKAFKICFSMFLQTYQTWQLIMFRFYLQATTVPMLYLPHGKSHHVINESWYEHCWFALNFSLAVGTTSCYSAVTKLIAQCLPSRQNNSTEYNNSHNWCYWAPGYFLTFSLKVEIPCVILVQRWLIRDTICS